MKLLFDLDGVAFRVLCATKDQDYYHQLRATYSVVERVLDTWDNPEYMMVFSGSGNFRKKLYPDYKSNRKDSYRPPYLTDVRNWFIKYYGAVVADGMEADDYLAMHSTRETCMIGNDKDLLTIPNTFIYNPWKDELQFIAEDYAWFRFFLQVLVGDAADGVPGLKNPQKLHYKNSPCFTESTATELLRDLSPKQQMETVQQQYQLIYGDDWFSHFDLTADLLWLRRDINKTYRDYLPTE